MRNCFTVLSFALVVAACNEGHDEFLNRDFTVVADLSGSSDMSDDGGTDAASGPTCGDMFKCLIANGLGGLGGGGGGTGGLGNLQMCFAGAQPAAIQQATQLGICAATNCLSGLIGGGNPDAGGFNPIQIGLCLYGKCPDQVAACQGLNLGFGGP